MKCKILVPVCCDGKGGNVLAREVALARGFNAYIEATTQKSFGVALPDYRGSSKDSDYDDELGVGLTISGDNF